MLKKILVILTACTLLLLGGCGKGSRTGATLKVDLTHSYVSEELTMQGMKLRPIAGTDQGFVMVLNRPEKKIYRLYLYDPTEKTFAEIPRDENHIAEWFTTLSDGRLAGMYRIKIDQKNGMDIYDPKQRALVIYNNALNIAEQQLIELPENRDNRIVAVDADDRWYLDSMPSAYDDTDASVFSALYVLDPDLTIKGQVNMDSIYFEKYVVGKSGKVYGLMQQEGSPGIYREGSCHIYRIDADQLSCELAMPDPLPVSPWSVLSGSRDSAYELYYYDTDLLFGLHEDGTSELVVDFLNSDLQGSMWDCFALPNENFIIEYSPDNAYTRTFGYYQLRPRTEDEIKNTQIISLAGVDLSKTLVQSVLDYNQSQLDYRIVMKDYAKEYRIANGISNNHDSYDDASGDSVNTEAFTQFQSDLLGGTVPDIICLDNMPYQQLSNKGLLTDLSPMLEADERFNPEEYYMNILDGLKKGEKLERIGFSYRITTAIAKTKFVGEQQGRTPEEYIAMIESIPEGMTLLPAAGRESYERHFLGDIQSSFIDKSTMTCSFDSEPFVKLLELTGSVKPQDELYANQEDYWEELNCAYSEDHTLLKIADIVKPMDYYSYHAGDFWNEDITLVGFPDVSGGNGGKYEMNYTIALTSRSDKVEPVWEFMMGELSSIRQSKVCPGTSDVSFNSLPLRRDTTDNVLLAATRGMNKAKESEMDVLRDYIEHLRMYADIDPMITKVIYEEADMYFAGDHTAQQAADMIQSRCSLYLSEQK